MKIYLDKFPLIVFLLALRIKFTISQLLAASWECHQTPSRSSDQTTGEVVSGSNREIIVDIIPQFKLRNARLDFYTKDGVLGCSVFDFIQRPTMGGDYVGSGHFSKHAPMDITYYAHLTMHDWDGNIYNYTSSDLQDVYYPSTYVRSNYAIQYVQDQKTLDARPPIKLTSFKVLESKVVINETTQITIESGFSSPIGVRTATIYVCSDGVNVCDVSNVLCNGEDRTLFPMYNRIESAQIEGNYTEGVYRTNCYINQAFVKPSKYYFGIRLVDTGGRDTAWGTEVLSKLGFSSEIEAVESPVGSLEQKFLKT